MNAQSPPLQPATDSTSLPKDFVFSQSSLQAYVDCPRRFWLTYVRQLPWPAVEATPIQQHEELMRMGAAFHRLVQRAEIGIDPEVVADRLPDPLASWFAAYQRTRPADLPSDIVEAEQTMSMRFSIGSTKTEADEEALPSYRIAALFDLLTVEPGERAVIVDWKTSRRRPEPSRLRDRLQSRIYPFLLVEAANNLDWGPLQPDQVEMRYWFTVAPDQPIRFRHDATQHAETGRYLERLLLEISAGEGEANFPKVLDTATNRLRFCQFCIYRSRCDRGETPGDLDEQDTIDLMDETDLVSPDGLDFTLDDLQELAF